MIYQGSGKVECVPASKEPPYKGARIFFVMAVGAAVGLLHYLYGRPTK